MRIKNSQQDIIIELSSNIKNVGLKISGGADSAIVGYILSKYVVTERPDIKIVPITVQQTKKYNIIFAKRIIEFYKKEFGDIFLDHYTDISFKTDFCTVQEKLMKHLYERNIINFHFTGLSLNPPAGVIESITNYAGLIEPPDRVRTGTLKPTYGMKHCSPLINIDKKGISELYRDLNLLDTLFPLTRSCSADTDDFSRHCGLCWFCAERFWAFNRYD